LFRRKNSRVPETIANDLKTHGYSVTQEYKLEAKRIDLLAQKGNYIFAIEVKNRPIETFDIASSSSVSTKLKSKDFRDMEVFGVLTSNHTVPEEMKNLGKRVGVLVTAPNNLSQDLEAISQRQSSRNKARMVK
jgi:Holliday junction resolvase-like predicted endonuclease